MARYGETGRIDEHPRKTNTSGYTGVYYIKPLGKYQAAITFNYRRYTLGVYTDIKAAAHARKEASEHVKNGNFIEWYAQAYPKQYASFLKGRMTTNGGERRVAIDLAGQEFGNLTAIYSTKKRQNGSVIWKCRCKCGKTHYVSASSLMGGNARGCGCRRGRPNPTGIKGVTAAKNGKYRYSIKRDGKVFYFGTYSNLDDIREIDARIKNMSAEQLAEYHKQVRGSKNSKTVSPCK